MTEVTTEREEEEVSQISGTRRYSVFSVLPKTGSGGGVASWARLKNLSTILLPEAIKVQVRSYHNPNYDLCGRVVIMLDNGSVCRSALGT